MGVGRAVPVLVAAAVLGLSACGSDRVTAVDGDPSPSPEVTASPEPTPSPSDSPAAEPISAPPTSSPRASAASLATVLLSARPDGRAGNDYSNGRPAVSADGRVVVFSSHSSDLLGKGKDTNKAPDVFAFDRASGELERISVASDGTEANKGGASADLSADGRWVTYSSGSTNLGAPDDLNLARIFLHDRQTGRTTTARPSGPDADGLRACGESSISGDGRWIALTCDGPGGFRVLLWDRTTGQTTRVADDGTNVEISDDGSTVVYQNQTNVFMDYDGGQDVTLIYAWDRTTGRTEKVSVSSAGTVPGPSDSISPSVSADGRWVVFVSDSRDLVATPKTDGRDEHVYLHDRRTGATRRLTEQLGWTARPSISGDGRWVTVTGRRDGDFFVYLVDARSGTATLASVAVRPPGKQPRPTYSSGDSRISADGRTVAFNSDAPNLVAGDKEYRNDVYVRTLP